MTLYLSASRELSADKRVMAATASALPILHGRPRAQPVFERLAVLLAAFCPVFVILSLSYEALFYAVYSAALVTWVTVESRLSASTSPKEGKFAAPVGALQLVHVRVSLFFLAFFNLGFFGCGNVASISSVSRSSAHSLFRTKRQLTLYLLYQFYLEPVYRLMTIFAPFPMVRCFCKCSPILPLC